MTKVLENTKSTTDEVILHDEASKCITTYEYKSFPKKFPEVKNQIPLFNEKYLINNYKILTGQIQDIDENQQKERKALEEKLELEKEANGYNSLVRQKNHVLNEIAKAANAYPEHVAHSSDMIFAYWPEHTERSQAPSASDFKEFLKKEFPQHAKRIEELYNKVRDIKKCKEQLILIDISNESKKWKEENLEN